MKKLIIILSLILYVSCSTSSNSDENNLLDENTHEDSASEWKCGTHNGKTLWTGPKGGCYYYNSKGNKTYVDRSECHC
ncbi:hypothetical protein [Tenacibaculum sp.]|uniref:hypothetical protein n=1 Tax=Tenacibaculum sp. TaxID=1906242 RepID=UPI003D0B3CC4